MKLPVIHVENIVDLPTTNLHNIIIRITLNIHMALHVFKRSTHSVEDTLYKIYIIYNSYCPCIIIV